MATVIYKRGPDFSGLMQGIRLMNELNMQRKYERMRQEYGTEAEAVTEDVLSQIERGREAPVTIGTPSRWDFNKGEFQPSRLLDVRQTTVPTGEPLSYPERMSLEDEYAKRLTALGAKYPREMRISPEGMMSRLSPPGGAGRRWKPMPLRNKITGNIIEGVDELKNYISNAKGIPKGERDIKNWTPISTEPTPSMLGALGREAKEYRYMDPERYEAIQKEREQLKKSPRQLKEEKQVEIKQTKMNIEYSARKAGYENVETYLRIHLGLTPQQIRSAGYDPKKIKSKIKHGVKTKRPF